MKNLISIIEIPTRDLSRAITFYQTVLGVQIEQVDMGEMQIGVFPGDDVVNVSLIHGSEYRPSGEGTLVYFNAGDDLQAVLGRIQSSGGDVLLPKTEISPEMGFFAFFRDTEGNKLGLHALR